MFPAERTGPSEGGCYPGQPTAHLPGSQSSAVGPESLHPELEKLRGWRERGTGLQKNLCITVTQQIRDAGPSPSTHWESQAQR